MSNQDILLWMVESIFIPIGQFLLILWGIISFFLVIKYRSLVFWWDATKKEKLLFKIFIIGFLVCMVMSIILAVLSQ